MKKSVIAALVAATIVVVAAVAVVTFSGTPQPIWQDHYKQRLAQEYMHIAWKWDHEIGDLVGLLEKMEKEGYYNNQDFTKKVLADITTPAPPTEYTVEREVKIGENTYKVVWDKYEVLPSGLPMLVPYEPRFGIIRTVHTFSCTFIAGTPTPMPLYATTK